jgi:hypothetical protein
MLCGFYFHQNEYSDTKNEGIPENRAVGRPLRFRGPNVLCEQLIVYRLRAREKEHPHWADDRAPKTVPERQLLWREDAVT